MSPSLLLTKLPPELRELIWEFTLRVPPTNKDDVHEIVWLTPDPRPRPSVLSLLLTCRQINHEATEIFYSINKLAVDVAASDQAGPGPARDPRSAAEGSLTHFLQRLSPRRLSALHLLCIWLGEGSVEWHMWHGPSSLATTLKRLRRVPSLRTIHLMWDQPSDRQNFIYKCDSVVKALGQLRQVEEVTIWGRDASQEVDSRAEYCAEQLQRHLPRQRAKDKVVEEERVKEYMRNVRRG